MVSIRLNGKIVEAGETMTALEAARAAGIDIPTLCHHEALGPYGACRLCVVEAEGPMLRRSLVASCTLPVSEGLSIETATPQVLRSRKVVFQLLLGRSPDSPELREMAKRYGVESTPYHAPVAEDCVRCGLCVRTCRARIGVSAISFAGRGQKRRVTAEFGKLSGDCIGCGACAAVCPVKAITLHDEGEVRTIRMKDRVIAEHVLERCRVCGTPFAPKRYLAFVSGRTADHPVQKRSMPECPLCSRERSAEAMTGEVPGL